MASVKRRSWTTAAGEHKEAWQLSYQDRQGRQRRKQFTTKRAADRERVRIENELQAGTHVPERDSLTVILNARDWLDAFEDLVKAGVRERITHKKYKGHVEVHLAHYDIAGIRLSQLTGPDCNAFARELVKALSPHMVKKVWGTFKKGLKHAIAEGRLTINPAAEIKLQFREDDDAEGLGQVSIPSKAGLRAILQAATRFDNTGRAEAFVRVSLFSGVRNCELRALGEKAVTLKGREPALRITASAKDDNSLGKTKSKSSRRTIPLGPATLLALKRWYLAKPKGDHQLVFPNGAGNVESYGNFYHRLWVPLLAAAQTVLEKDKAWDGRETLATWDAEREAWVAGFGLNTMRHAAASLFIEQGMSPKKLKERMGHSTIRLTFDLYGHLWPEPQADHRAASEIERRILE